MSKLRKQLEDKVPETSLNGYHTPCTEEVIRLQAATDAYRASRKGMCNAVFCIGEHEFDCDYQANHKGLHSCADDNCIIIWHDTPPALYSAS